VRVVCGFTAVVIPAGSLQLGREGGRRQAAATDCNLETEEEEDNFALLGGWLSAADAI
jgi:hypothetical protein